MIFGLGGHSCGTCLPTCLRFYPFSSFGTAKATADPNSMVTYLEPPKISNPFIHRGVVQIRCGSYSLHIYDHVKDRYWQSRYDHEHKGAEQYCENEGLYRDLAINPETE